MMFHAPILRQKDTYLVTLTLRRDCNSSENTLKYILGILSEVQSNSRYKGSSERCIEIKCICRSNKATRARFSFIFPPRVCGYYSIDKSRAIINRFVARDLIQPLDGSRIHEIGRARNWYSQFIGGVERERIENRGGDLIYLSIHICVIVAIM